MHPAVSDVVATFFFREKTCQIDWTLVVLPTRAENASKQ